MTDRAQLSNAILTFAQGHNCECIEELGLELAQAFPGRKTLVVEDKSQGPNGVVLKVDNVAVIVSDIKWKIPRRCCD